MPIAFYPTSVKGRMIAVTVGLLTLFIWILVFFSATILQRQYERVLADQQYAATQRLAAELDNKLKERVQALSKVAANMPSSLTPQSLDAFLEQLGALHTIFTAGITVIGLDGKTIADFPVTQGRRGDFLGDRDYFRQVVATGKYYVDKPVMGRALKRPILMIGVPVAGKDGKLRAVMTGTTDLTASNFLGVISDPTMTGKGEFYVVSPRDNMIVASSNPKRMLAAPPPHGVNAMYDRLADGFDGSGIAATSEGISKLISGNHLSEAEWIVVAALPTAIAFGPVSTMQNALFIAGGMLTVFAFVVMLGVARRMLGPLEEAGKAMRRMNKGEAPLAPLPVQYQDEIGQMIGDFNLLIEGRRHVERELRKREEEFRALVENLPDLVVRCDQELRCCYANPAFCSTIGLSGDQAVGKTIEELRLPQDVIAMWSASISKVVTTKAPDTFEFSFPTLAGMRHYQARMVPEFGACRQVSNILAVARDISVIKGGEAVLRESEQRIHGITANTPGMVFQCQFFPQDSALLFTYVSEGSKQLLGLTPGQIQWNRNAIRVCLHEQDRMTFQDSLLHSAATMSIWNWEGRTLPHDGEEKWINCRATPRLVDDGSVIWEGVMLNITDSKRSEEEIRQSRQLLRELSAHMENVREEERKRIAREVHDELGQALTALRMDVSLLRLHFGGQSAQLLERIQSMKEAVDRTIQMARHVTSTLRPVALDLGLTAALEWLVEEFISHTGIDCRLVSSICDEAILDDNRATALFRIVQESLTNVGKHAEANQVEIVLRIESLNDETNLCVSIRDDGKGFRTESARKTGSFGLIGIRERVLMLHGALRISSAPEQGTHIEVCIPVEKTLQEENHIL